MNQQTKFQVIEPILISVVTVVYNGYKEIEETILNVLGQSYKNIEYIIIDGQSTDGTLNIIQKYKNRISYLISEKDKGVYDAMNKALKIANGDFLIFMNAGDKFGAYFTLEKFVQSITELNSIYYGDTLYFDFKNKEIFVRGGKFNSIKLCYTNICHQSIFYPRNVYETINYNTNYIVYADWEYNLRLWKQGVKFKYLPTIISNFVLGGFSSVQKDAQFKKDFSQIMIRNLGWGPYLYSPIRYFRLRKWLGFKRN